MLEKLRSFLAKETVLVVAAAAALASCALVPPDAAYGSYIDWHTLALLFCLMAVVSGLRFMGIMRALGRTVVRRAKTARSVCLLLVALAFFSSMLVTNDVALITFVPLALALFVEAKMQRFCAPIVVLMTVAANLGSMLLPIGNPQNLFLFQASGMGFGGFVALMAPLTAASAVMLLLASLFATRRGGAIEPVGADAPSAAGCPKDAAKLTVYLLLFALCVAAVAGALDAFVLAPVVAFVVGLCDIRALRKVDYGLLLTFVALFVFVGNMARVPAVEQALAGIANASPFFAAVGASQVISNVPAAVLLSGFTQDWPALIAGANVGGLGTLIASMASLISFKIAVASGMAEKKSYLLVFTGWNAAFLVALCALSRALGLV